MSEEIEITVKTLDSQSHKFNTSADNTVKQFKEQIAETVGIPAESQRFIYCGRVLQDEKKLGEYGIDKKVVHLVQKSPPNQQRPASSATGTSTRNTSSRRSGNSNRADRDGSMYLGALAFPSEIFSFQGTHDMIQTATQSRLTLIQNMLRQIESCISRIEQSNTSQAETSTTSSSAPSTQPESAAGEDGTPTAFGNNTETLETPINLSTSGGTFQNPVNLNTSGGAFPINLGTSGGAFPINIGSAGGAFPGSMNIGNSGGTFHVSSNMGNSTTGAFPMNLGGNGPDAMTGAVSAAVAGALSAIVSAVGTSMGTQNITIVQGGQQGSPSRVSHITSEPLRNTEGTRSGTETSGRQPEPNTQGSTGSAPTPVPVSVVVESFEHVLRLQDRLRPWIERTCQILRDDPVLPPNSPELRQAQRTFSAVSESLHFLSHAFHSLSDLGVGLTRPPPRQVGVRSIVLQPTAVLQAGFPIQAQINVMGNRVPSNGPSTQNSNTQQARESPESPPPSTQPEAASTTASDIDEHASTFNIGNNVEVIMEVGPAGFSIQHATTSSPTDSHATSQGANAGSPSGLPPFLIQQIMQAMANGMAEGGAIRIPHAAAAAAAASASRATASPIATGGSTSTNAPTNQTQMPGQTSQARGNTTTQPTTSTQTRSTPRPHVHLAPVNWQNPQSFDPFLSCNSHHIQPMIRAHEMAHTHQHIHRMQAPAQTSSEASPGQLFPGRLMNIISQMFGDSSSRGAVNTGLTVADFLTSMPDYSYTRGESFFTDLFVTIARQFTFRDLVQVSLRQSAPLNRLRLPLRNFVNEQLLNGESANAENMERAVDHIMQEVQPYLEEVRSSRWRADIDYEASLRQFFLARLPELMRLIVTDECNSNEFGSQLMTMCGKLVHDLASLTLMCCHGGRQGLERILHRYVQVLTGDLEPSIQQWTAANSRLPLRSFVQGLPATSSELEAFLVRRQTLATPVTAPPLVSAEPTALEASCPPIEEAMDCEEEVFVLAVEDPTQIAEPASEAVVQFAAENATSLPLPAMEVESSCEVMVGSEQWHTGLDSDWVPVITRDVQRQRRQSDQHPFSDAYLAGISSKRRKIIANNKPQGTVGQVITESLSRAARASGVQGVEQIARAAGSDDNLQSAYKEEVKKTVSKQLASNPDFTPERFPNASKHFDPCK